MRKIILIIFFSILFFQNKYFSQIGNYGIKVAIQSAGVYSNIYGMDRFYGLSLYGFTDFIISKNIFSTIDFGVTQRGFKNSMDERNETGEFVQKVIATSKLTYISFASFINVNLPLASSSIYFGTGPRFDFLTSKVQGEYSFTNVTVTDELVNYLDKYIFGVSFIAGVKNINFYGIDLRFEGKYEVDITDSMSKYPAEYRNNVFMVAVGISL